MRIGGIWTELPKSTKLLLAGLLFVGGLTFWYIALYLPAQTAEPPHLPPSETAGTPAQRAPASIEAPPPPFFATPGEPQKAPPPSELLPRQGNTEKPPSPPQKPPPLAQTPKEPPLPNPFAPLYVETPPPSPTATVTSPPRLFVPAPKPLPTGEPVRISPNRSTSSPTKLPLPTGTPLPLPQVVRSIPPLSLPELEPSQDLGVPTALSLKEVLTSPGASGGEGQGAQESRPTHGPVSPLQDFVQERGIQLSGVLLGPISVAIFESKEGYQVLPVGSTWPNSEVVIRSASADSVELALKGEVLRLFVHPEGGEP